MSVLLKPTNVRSNAISGILAVGAALGTAIVILIAFGAGQRYSKIQVADGKIPRASLRCDFCREIPFRPTKHPLLGDDSRARPGDEGPDPAVDGSRL